MGKPIQLVPPGFLGLLQLKQMGKNPVEMLETVAPVFPLADWYLRSIEIQLNTTYTQLMAASAAGGYQAFTNPAALTVPEDEWWWVANYAARGGLVAGDTVNGLRTALQTNRTGTVRFGRFGNPINLAGQGSVVCFDSGFWAPPGAEFGLHVTNVVSAAGVTFTADLRYSPCPI